MSKYYESYNREACPYNEKCGSCVYLDINRSDSSNKYKFWCSDHRNYYPVNDEICSYFKYFFDESKDYELVASLEYHSDCYITTIVTKLLGLGDNNELLNTLRLFRKNTLQTNPMYKNILMEYDIIGPIIADCIENDRELYDINVLEKYIRYCVSLVKQGKETEAVTIYINMVNMLKEIFNISFEQVKCDNYDYTVGGHGYVKNR